MKKFSVVCACLGISLIFQGCSLGNLVDRYLLKEDMVSENTEPPKERVYMDELKGTLQDFNGTSLTVSSGENSYVFDVSQATLECQEGMITGDEISVIYEGQLSDTDTSMVKALKVVDEFHKKITLEDQVVHGQIQNLTPNTITLLFDDNHTATYPITGTQQYYQTGVKAGNPVYLHFKGTFPQSQDSVTLNASHLKVLSISDTEPYAPPQPTPTPEPSLDNQEDSNPVKQFRAVIQNLSLQILHVMPEGADMTLYLDISSIPCYFSGGTAPGSYITVYYTGELQPNTLEGVTLLSVIGDNPDGIRESHLTYSVSGTIIGSTANTITIQTPDGASITCTTDTAANSSTGGLLTGSSVRIIFNPSASRTSNIYTSLKIEDA